MKIKDLPPGTKFLFYWFEDTTLEHVGIVITSEYSVCNCGMELAEHNYEEEVYPILEWEDECDSLV